MQYDYSKIVAFLYGKEEKKLNDVLKEVLTDGFIMLDVSVPNKIILLEKNNMKYVLLKNKDRILIIPDTYRGSAQPQGMCGRDFQHTSLNRLPLSQALFYARDLSQLLQAHAALQHSGF